MKKSLKKRGQKIIRKFSRNTTKVREAGKHHVVEHVFQRINHVQSIRLLILEWVLLVSAVIMLGVSQSFWFSEPYASQTFTSGGNYVEGTVGRISSLNPLFAATSSEKALSRLLFTPLVGTDDSGKLGGQLVHDIRTSEGGKIWTMRLKDGLKWSDGEPITNADVIFTTDLIKNPATNTIYDNNLRTASVSESESGEIVFTLTRSYADFLSALTFPIIPKHKLEDVNPKNLIESGFSTEPVGSGAFKLNVIQATSGDEKTVHLQANPYFYRGHPMLDSFSVHAFATEDDLISALGAGTITATAELSEPDLAKFTTAKYAVQYSPINSGVFAFINMRSDSMKNKTLRTAIRQGINLENIRAAAGNVESLDYPLMESQISLANYPDLPRPDPLEASLAIVELGEIPTINIATANYGNFPAVAEALAAELRSLGLEAVVSLSNPGQEFLDGVIAKRAYDILIYEIELGSDPDLLAYYHSSQAKDVGLNLSNYQNALVDDILIAARETLDKDLRVKKYESFLDYWVKDVPAIALYQSSLVYVANSSTRTFSDDTVFISELDRFNNVHSWAVNKAQLNSTP